MASDDTGIEKRGRGRPRKEKKEPEILRGRGRPLGSKNKKKKAVPSAPKQSKRKSADLPAVSASETQLFHKHRSLKNLPAETPEELAYNQKLIEHVLRVNEIAVHADRSDLLSLKSCFVAYLKLCQEDGFGVSNLAAYAAMGFYDNTSFASWAKRRDDPAIREFAALVKNTCAMFREGMITDSKLNPVIGIFWQRNYDGLRNDTEQIQPVTSDDDVEMNKGYKDKYRHLIGGSHDTE